jgi:hypothetical protein
MSNKVIGKSMAFSHHEGGNRQGGHFPCRASQLKNSRIPNKRLSVKLRAYEVFEGKDLRARWRTIFRNEPLVHLSHNLLFRILVYQLQVESFGGLDTEYQRALENPDSVHGSGAEHYRRTRIQQGAILCREWKGRIHLTCFDEFRRAEVRHCTVDVRLPRVRDDNDAGAKTASIGAFMMQKATIGPRNEP